MRSEFLPGLPKFPLVFRPEGPHDPLLPAGELAAWTRDNKARLDADLLQYGALLFRGFGVSSEEEFQSVVSAFVSEFGDYTGGIAPRRTVAGAVTTSTDAPAIMPIPLHLEMAYFDEYPRRVMFFCKTPPTQGGQTPLADMQALYEDLDPDVRSTLEERGQRIIQNIGKKRTLFGTRSWPEMFGADKQAVAAYCARHGIEASWNKDDSMRLITTRPVSILHPETGARVWFGSTSMHASFSWELNRVGNGFAAWIMRMIERRNRGKPNEALPYQVTYADGTDIPIRDIDHIRAKTWEHAVMFDWQQGDILVLDNSRIAHGRMPFKGKRRIRAALSESLPAVAAPMRREAAPLAPEITV